MTKPRRFPPPGTVEPDRGNETEFAARQLGNQSTLTCIVQPGIGEIQHIDNRLFAARASPANAVKLWPGACPQAPKP